MPSVEWSPTFGGSSSSTVKAARVLGAEMVEAPLPPAAVGSVAARHRPLRLGPFDGFNLRLWYIEATYFYEEELDVSALRSSLSGLLARYPSFAGRAKKQQRSTASRRSDDIDGANNNNDARPGTGSLWSGYSVVTDSTTSESSSNASGVPLIEIAVDGSMSEAMVDSSHRHSHGFANMPDLAEAAGGGQTFSDITPLMTVTVVTFGKGGGSALAVAVSHGLVDGKGFAELMKSWSFAHENGWDHPKVPVLVVERPSCLLDGVSTGGRGGGAGGDAGTRTTVESSVTPGTTTTGSTRTNVASNVNSNSAAFSPLAVEPAKDESSSNGACVCDVRTAQGFGQHVHVFEPMVWNLAGQRRARTYFTWDEISALKTLTPCTGSRSVPDSPSSTRRIMPTSTEALGARIWRTFSDVVFPVLSESDEPNMALSALPAATEHKVQPYLLAHMRSPRHPEIPALFLGNCVQELSGAIVDNPTDLGAVCGQFRAASEAVRNKAALATVVAAHEAKIRGLKEGVLPSIGSAPSADAAPVHRFQLNAKQSFRVMDHSWGAGSCVGVIPLNAGADLQIVDALGGVHVYLGCPSWASETAPADWIEQVEATAFRTRVLAMGAHALASTSTSTAAKTAVTTETPAATPKKKGSKFKAAAVVVMATLDFVAQTKPPLTNLRQLRKQLEEKVAGKPTAAAGTNIKKSSAFHTISNWHVN